MECETSCGIIERDDTTSVGQISDLPVISSRFSCETSKPAPREARGCGDLRVLSTPHKPESRALQGILRVEGERYRSRGFMLGPRLGHNGSRWFSEG